MGTWWNLFSGRQDSEFSFSDPYNQMPNGSHFFSYFDFSKSDDREFYLLCATQENADRPVLIKVKCRCEVNESRYWKYIFSCVVTEIEGEQIADLKKNLVESKSDYPISMEKQMQTLRDALMRAHVEGNPIRVSEDYIERHLRIARTRKDIKARKERKEVAHVFV